MADLNTTAELISVLSKLQHNYTSLAQYWYDIFYNPEPKVVSIDFYDADGEKILITIDNLAKIRQSMAGIYGTGMPDPTLSVDFGTIYHDTSDGSLYRFAKDYSNPDETAGYWDLIITADVLGSIIVKDDDPIVNRVTVQDGVLYLARDTHKLYMGRNGEWQRIDASPSSINEDNFKVTSNEYALTHEGIVLSTACEDKASVSVYVDGVLFPSEKYTIENNGFALRFLEPIISPEEGKSIDITVKYFTNLSIYEEFWEEEEVTLDDGSKVMTKKFTFAKDLFKTLQSITTRINELLQDADSMRVEMDIVSEQLAAIKKDLAQSVQATADELAQSVRVIADNVKAERSAIETMYSSVKTWYDQSNEIRADIRDLKTDINDNISWLMDLFTDPVTGKLDLTKFVYKDDLTIALNNQQVDYVDKIATAKDELTTLINNSNTLVHALEVTIMEDKDNIEANTVAIATLKSELEDTEARVMNKVFSEFNYPIDYFGVVKNNKHLYAPFFYDIVNPRENEAEYADVDDEDLKEHGIQIDISRDFAYYTLDFTNDLNNFGDDKIYRYFMLNNSISIDQVNDTNISQFEVQEPSTEAVSGTDDMYFIQVRVIFRNGSPYRPRIVWSNTNIEWFGGEEPDFEAGTNYMIEFISADYGESWTAHTLGICQPSIRTAELTRTFNINLTDFSTNYLGVPTDVFYTKADGTDMYAGTYNIDNGGVIRGVTLSFNSNELGERFSNLRIHTQTDGLFVSHPVTGYNSQVNDELPLEEVNCKLGTNRTDNHSYTINLVSDDFTSDECNAIITFAQMVNGKEETVQIGPNDESFGIEDSMCVIELESDMFVNNSGGLTVKIFDGADPVRKTTPWYIKTVDVFYEFDDTDKPIVVLKGTANVPLRLDGESTIYVEKV